MSRIADNLSSTPSQNGAKIIGLPLKQQGNYYATEVRRNYVADPITSYQPLLGARYSYTQALLHSDDVSNAAWTKTNASGTAAAAVDPEGQTLASKLGETTTNAAHSAAQTLTLAAGLTGFGVLLKQAERNFVRLRISNGTDGTVVAAVFNLATGVVFSGTGTIKRLLNGWYWCYVTGTPTVSNSTVTIDLSTDGSTFSYAGTTGSGCYVFHATAYLCSAMGPALYSAAATRSVSCPAVDEDDPIAFIMEETEPEASAAMYGTAIWSRIYRNIPATTIVPSFQFVTKPVIPGDFPQEINGKTVVQPDPTVAKYEFFTRIDVIGDSGVPTFSNPTGGTYTVRYGGSVSTALAYNVSPVTAINAMTSISNRAISMAVSAASGGYRISWVTGYATVAMSRGPLTIAGASYITGATYQQRNSSRGHFFNFFAYSAVDATPPYNGPQAAGTITGGTFTVTFFGNTTSALAYNITTAALQTAVRALAGCEDAVVTVPTGYTAPLKGDSTRLEFTVTLPFPDLVAVGSSLTPTGSNVAVLNGAYGFPYVGDPSYNTRLDASETNNHDSLTINGTTPSGREITATAHGIVAADNIVVIFSDGTSASVTTGKFTVPDANRIAFQNNAGDAFSSSLQIVAVGKATGQGYAAGVVLVRITRETTFYLPGVSPGITTVADIPLPTYQGDPASLLEAILDASTSINLEVGDLQRWKDTDILAYTIVKCNAATI